MPAAARKSKKPDPLVARLGATGLRQERPIMRMGLSSGGRLVATGDYEGVVRILDAATGACLQELPRPFKPARRHSAQHVALLSISADGRRVAARYGSVYGRAAAFDVETGKLLLLTESPYVQAIALSPDGALLAACDNNWLTLFDLDRGEAAKHLKVSDPDHESGPRNALAISPDGKLLATSWYDRDAGGHLRVRLHHLPSGKVKDELEIGERLVDPEVAFLPGGRLALREDTATWVWDLAKGGKARRQALDVPAGTRDFHLRLLGPLGAVAKLDPGSEVLLLDAVTGKVRRELPAEVGEVACTPEGDLLTGAAGVAVRLWEVEPWRERTGAPELSTRVGAVAFEPDGRALLTGDTAGVRRWQLPGGALTATLVEGDVHALSPDGALALLSRKGVDQVVELPSGKRRGLLSSNGVLSPDGKHAATRENEGGGGLVVLWDLASGKELRRFNDHVSNVYGICFSPDGKLLASCDWAGRLLVRELASGKSTALRCARAAYALALSPDGKHLGAGCADRPVRLFSLPGGSLSELKGHSRTPVRPVVFSPDSRLLASADELSVRVWEARTGTLVGLVREPAYALAFSPDSGWLALGGSGVALVVDVAKLPRK